MSAISSWHKLRKLSKAELTLLLWAIVLLPLMALSLKFFGFRRIYFAIAKLSGGERYLSPMVEKSQGRDESKCLTKAHRIARIVGIASQYGFYSANCLQKSLVIWWLLQREGIETDLRIGVRKQEESLEAHAWVEYFGVVLNDRSDVRERFAPFADAISPMGAKAP
ncbi:MULTISPECIES: lasso peptide biosynthesis B2 protein [Aerosakkonema]|uniref:lasso peptide biosynthesis B2 protein n=1 Tax=Aerosakkonema TaxID=1246629 RepID=UPI0035B9EDF4